MSRSEHSAGRDRVLGPLHAVGKQLIKSSTHRQRIVDCDRSFEIIGLAAGNQANVLKRRKLLLGFGGLSEDQIELTEVLVGAAVAAIEHQRLLICAPC
jgi:hypothetical protein